MMKRTAMWRTAIVVAVVGTVGFTVPVRGQEVPQIQVEPKVVVEGGEVKVDGTGFQPGTARLFVDEVEGKPLAELEHEGQFNFLVEISGVAAGAHAMIACNEQARDGSCRELAADSFTVEPPPTTTTSPPRTTTTTKPPRATTTTKPPRATTTTSRPAPTTSRPAPPTLPPPPPGPTDPPVTTSAPPSVTIAPTDPPLAVGTTSPPIPTIPPALGAAPTTIGPDPTFDPSADGLAVATTTTVPDDLLVEGNGEFPDVSVAAIEVSQGIQNLASSMPLVADRTTWVRVHVESSGSDPWAPVDGLLLVERGGSWEILVPDNGPISTKLPRTELDSTLNFELEQEWIEEGELSITAGVWSFSPDTVASLEPNAANNELQIEVEFHVADVPTIWLVALDDGGGPGPVVNDLTPLLGFGQVVHQDLLDFHPTADVDYEIYPEPVAPGPEALEPGIWDLGLDQDLDDPDGPEEETAGARRHEPNIRMAWLLQDIPEEDNVLGWIDNSIPTDGYSGWAGYGVAWNKPKAGTPAHELGHSRGLKHVPCKDADDDGIPDEAKGGAIDWTHPTGLPPQCSLAPISEAGYYGLTTERTSLEVFSNDPTDPAAAYEFMSYKGPKWAGPYHWCLLLEEVGVPCSPASIGVPPKIILPPADCSPEPAGGFGLDLCLVDELPPVEPFAGSPAPFGIVPCAGDSLLIVSASVLPDDDPVCAAADGPPYYDVQLQNIRIADTATTSAISLEPVMVTNSGQGGEIDAALPYQTITLKRGYTSTLDLYVLAPAEPGQWLLVSGTVDGTTGEASIGQAALRTELRAGTHDRFLDGIEGALAGLDPATPIVEVVNRDGTVVTHIPVELDGAGHGDDGERGSSSGFFQAVPMPGPCAGCTVSLIAGDGSVLDQFTVSSAAPEVSAVTASSTPAGIALSWEASDPDGDDLSFDVLWSMGDDWLPVANGIDERSIVVPPSARFPGGDAVVVRVVANDGARTAEAVSAPFGAPTHEPWLSITGGPDSGAIEQHETITLQAHVFDPEDVGRSPSLSWSSSLDGALGTGALLRTRELDVGVHTISATAVDGDGNSVTAVVTLEVTERRTPTRRGEQPDPAGVALLMGSDPVSAAASAVGADGEPSTVGADEVAGGAQDAVVTADSSSTWAPWAIAAGAVGLAGGVLVSRRRTDGSGRVESRTGP